jgi:hypothetical protein
MRTHQLVCRLVLALSAVALTAVSAACADDAAAQEAAARAQQERERYRTAVALNYCRAAFHHIRKTPTKAMLVQQQQQILNNLNLDGINDPEIIRLYTGVLDEIGEIEIADRERHLLQQQYRRNITQKITWDALAFGTALATAQVGSAIKTGADSWWDYRNETIRNDRDILRVDTRQMDGVVQKSSMFLDTFWKLAQSRSIPDRLLVRGTDLDRLDDAMQQQDTEVRLRILRRMEPFMEAYPPYWYYVARTQQSMSQWADATETYRRLAELGDGHFRRDDMLATGLANRAAIEDFLGLETAVATAEQALNYSTEVWEANLLCARVLERHEQLVAAEDAILRNLDVGLETYHSRVCQVSLYYHSGQQQKLVEVLSDSQVVATLPMSVVIRCAAMLGPEQTPSQVTRAVAGSIEARPRVSFGSDDLLVTATPAWQLDRAEVRLIVNGQEISAAEPATVAASHQLRFAAPRDWGNPFRRIGGKPEVAIRLTYPDATTIRISFEGATVADAIELPMPRTTTPTPLRMATIDVDDTRLSIPGEATARNWEVVPASETKELPSGS